jgi:energy-converting hydrogenase Eha subunit C
VWRYVRPFLVFKPNKITNHAEFVFRRLRLLGMSIGLVTDVLYHSKTIYYLRRSSFYSIGLVPSIYHINTVDFAIPTTYESVLTQIFFVRFLVRIKQVSLSSRYSELISLWSGR